MNAETELRPIRFAGFPDTKEEPRKPELTALQPYIQKVFFDSEQKLDQQAIIENTAITDYALRYAISYFQNRIEKPKKPEYAQDRAGLVAQLAAWVELDAGRESIINVRYSEHGRYGVIEKLVGPKDWELAIDREGAKTTFSSTSHSGIKPRSPHRILINGGDIRDAGAEKKNR